MLWLSIQTSVLPFPPVKRIDPDKANAARTRIIRNQRMYEFKLAFKLTLTILLRLNLGLNQRLIGLALALEQTLK